MRPQFFSIFLVGLVSACATNPAPEMLWSKPGEQEQQKTVDIQICTAKGYQVAGPMPRLQVAPPCATPGFACGMAKGQVAASNGLVMGSWKAAYQSGFDSCMYEKGYFQARVTN